MLNPQTLELRVGVDVGSRSHHVAAADIADLVVTKVGMREAALARVSESGSSAARKFMVTHPAISGLGWG